MNPKQPQPQPDETVDEQAPPDAETLAEWRSVPHSPNNQEWDKMVEKLDNDPRMRRLLRALARPPME